MKKKKKNPCLIQDSVYNTQILGKFYHCEKKKTVQLLFYYIKSYLLIPFFIFGIVSTGAGEALVIGLFI